MQEEPAEQDDEHDDTDGARVYEDILPLATLQQQQQQQQLEASRNVVELNHNVSYEKPTDAMDLSHNVAYERPMGAMAYENSQ